nr:MAG TPA: hypothetical protein [Caudoviricetes sp.]
MIDCEFSVLVGRKKIEFVAYTYQLSEHAKVQLLRRGTDLSVDLRDRILNSPLAWKVRDGRIAIALSLYEYIVVYVPRKGLGQSPTIITYVDTTRSGVNVIDKMLISYREYYQNAY